MLQCTVVGRLAESEVSTNRRLNDQSKGNKAFTSRQKSRKQKSEQAVERKKRKRLLFTFLSRCKCALNIKKVPMNNSAKSRINIARSASSDSLFYV